MVPNGGVSNFHSALIGCQNACDYTRLFGCLQVLAAGMRRFHLLGYPMRSAKLASIWVGGKLLTIDNLVRSMAREFGASEDQVVIAYRSIDQSVDKINRSINRIS